jgi:hypothetical protein
MAHHHALLNGEIPGWRLKKRSSVGRVYTDGNTHVTVYEDFPDKGGIPVDKVCEALDLFEPGTTCGRGCGGTLAAFVGSSFKVPAFTYDKEYGCRSNDGVRRDSYEPCGMRLGRPNYGRRSAFLQRAVSNPVREETLRLRADRDERRYVHVPPGRDSCLMYSS